MVGVCGTEGACSRGGASTVAVPDATSNRRMVSPIESVSPGRRIVGLRNGMPFRSVPPLLPTSSATNAAPFQVSCRWRRETFGSLIRMVLSCARPMVTVAAGMGTRIGGALFWVTSISNV